MAATPAAAAAARRQAIEAARIAEEDKCEDVLVLDLRGLSPVCDYFVIATGSSDRQLRAVANHIEEAAKVHKDAPFSRSGVQEGEWIVLDFVDVVIHLFEPEHREFYDLEMLWGDAPKVSWQRRTRKAPAAV